MKQKKTVSVILPVYNERATFLRLIKKILNVKIQNVKFQIIIIESNSDDGTRDLVKSLSKKKFDLIFQSKPGGKGSAVIDGLKIAKGDIILIQDGDLEYDPKDYHVMLKPILNEKENFVLGSRIKKGIFGIRKFKKQFFTSFIFNFSHILLTLTFNLLYKQKLKDPWTCYKVFKKECLKNIEFKCLGFDFDMELLCKLINNGYYPLEVPVSYKARSHKQGKKVSLINDGPKVIFAMIKSKF